MYSIGIDIGGMSAKLGLIEKDVVIKEEIIPTSSTTEYELFIDAVYEGIKHLSEENKIKKVGISSFGLIDSRMGSIIYANNVKWENKSIVSDLSRRIKLPIKIANDAKCAALAEAVYGAGLEYERVCMITIGTGVGGGFIINKQLGNTNPYSDADGILGHITVVNDGKICTCGRKGCLEAYSSATAIMQSYQEKTGEEISTKDIFQKGIEGHKVAQEIINQFKYYLAEGLISLVNVLRPEVIVIGGGVAKSADLFLPYLNEYVNSQIFGGMALPVKIVKAKLGNKAGMIGATVLY